MRFTEVYRNLNAQVIRPPNSHTLSFIFIYNHKIHCTDSLIMQTDPSDKVIPRIVPGSKET